MFISTPEMSYKLKVSDAPIKISNPNTEDMKCKQE